jgi:hypothetical protein
MFFVIEEIYQVFNSVPLNWSIYYISDTDDVGAGSINSYHDDEEEAKKKVHSLRKEYRQEKEKLLKEPNLPDWVY